MASQHDIRYINSFVSGNVAYQIEPKINRPSKTINLPKLPKQTETVKQKTLQICVEPLALIGIVLAVILLVMLAAGVIQLMNARADALAMEQYLHTLELENVQLQDTYKSGYDLAEIEEMALAMGMIPREEATHIQISVSMPLEPSQSQELGFWDGLVTFLSGLFA